MMKDRHIFPPDHKGLNPTVSNFARAAENFHEALLAQGLKSSLTRARKLLKEALASSGPKSSQNNVHTA